MLVWERLAWYGGSLRWHFLLIFFPCCFVHSSELFSFSLLHFFFVCYCIYCCWLISFSYFLNSSFVCCCLLLILFTLVSSSSLCFFIFLFVCYSLLPRKIWMSLSGHVPAWARSDHRRRLYDQDRRDRWREDQTADLGHCWPGAVRAWYSDQCMFDNCVPNCVL